MRPPSGPPFRQRPLVWGAPPSSADAGADSVITPPGVSAPSGGNGVGDRTAALSPITFGVNYTTGNINTAFPQAVRVATQGFTTAVGIVSVELASTMANNTTDGVMGVFVAKNVGATINLLANTFLYVAHLVIQNATHSMRSGMAFADDVCPRLGSNEEMAIYISSAGTGFANNRAAALCTIRYFSLA